MAQDINIKMTLTDGGTVDARVSDAKRLNKELEKTAATTEKINASNSRMPRSASAALDRSGPSAREVVDYNAQRGASGAAGGTARDFAAQAQGLGGLVRLYATFAANIFAVATAFTALKNAYNTEKMIAASERFSATVGVNLRAVSKDLQEATQYSLTFAEAVKFTNVGTAAGLAAKDIQNLTVIAKGAATALGRDVGESIQRIIQGTAKQEQEILDELGIFIKSKKAFDEYAAARNMKADDLTATQRTLAYAEAVAKAGEKWKEFANIEDPFGRLSAELQNTLNQVLNTVNKIAAPIASFFADNSKAILALGMLITTSLVQRALPELKTAFLGALTFDNTRAKLAAELMRNTLGQQLSDITLKAEEAARKLKALQATSIDLSKSNARENIVKGMGLPKDSLQSSGLAGFSAARLGTAFFDPKNIEQIKTFEDSQKAVLGTVKEQLKNEEKRAQILADQIARGNLDKASTYDRLILSEKGNMVAAAMFAKQQELLKVELAKTEAQKTQLALEQQRLTLAGKYTKAGGTELPKSSAASLSSPLALGTAQVAAQVLSTNDLTKATNAATEAGKKLGQVTLETAKNAMGLKLAFAQVSSNLEAARTNAAAEGVWAQFKEAGKTVAGVGANIAAVTAGTTLWGRATATAGAIAATSLGAVRLALGGVMAALGPLMAAWAIWELAGPWIKETFLGINRELEKLKEKAAEASKELEDSFSIANKALERSNTILASRDASSEQLSKALDARANAFKTILDSIEKEKAAQKAIEEFSAFEAKFKSAGSKGIGSDEAKAIAAVKERLKLAKELGVQSPEIAQLEEAFTRLNEAVSDPDSYTGLEKFIAELEKIKTLGSSIKLLDDLAQKMKQSQVEAAQLAKITTGLKSLGDYVSGTDIIAKAGAKNSGFGTDAEGLKAFKTFEELKTTAKTMQSLANAGKGLGDSASVAAESISKMGKAALLMGISTKELNPLIDKSNKLIEINAQLTSLKAQVSEAAAKGDLATATVLTGQIIYLTRSANALSDSLNTGLAGGEEGFRKLLISLSNSQKQTSQYSTDAKKAFKELEQDINAAEAAVKALNAALDVSQKLNSLRANYTGQQNLDNKLLKDKLVILEQEYDIEAKKAFLAKEKVRLSKTSDPGARAEAEDSYIRTIQALDSTKQQKTLLLEIEQVERTRNENLRQIDERAKLAADAAERSLSLAKVQLDLEKAYGDSRATALGLTREETQYEALLLDQQLKRLDAATRTAAIKRESESAKSKITEGAEAEFGAIRAKFGPAENMGPRDRDLMNTALLEAEKARDAALQKINAETQRKLELDSQQLSAAEKLMEMDRNRLALISQQSSATQKLAKLSTSIMGAFKGTGMEKQAKALTDILKVSQSSAQKMAKFDEANKTRKEKNLAEIAKATERASKNEAGAIGELAGLKLKMAEEEKASATERRDMELEAVTENLSAFKTMFSEKTAAYKVLDGIERAMHAFKMAMMAQQLAMDIKNTAVAVANAFTKATANTAEAGAKQATEGDVYTAIPRAIAVVAALAALISSAGGSGAPKIPGGTSAKDRQETQGTGMSWVNGEKVENGNGVFGDSEAKSESIKKSLELIAENTIEGLSFDRAMLNALESIDKAIGSAAKSIYGIQGLRKGSIGNTIEGTQSGGGLLGTGLFSSKRSTDIIDSGITISGSISQLMQGINSTAIKFYETVQTTTKKWYGSTKTSVSENVKAADAVILEQFANIFQNAEKVFIEAGKSLGKSVEDVKAQFGAISFSDFKFSARDLKGEDLEKELNSFISSALDTAAAQLFSSMKKYQEFGEGLLETVVRVTDANKKINLALNAIGNSSNAWANLAYDVTESIVDTFGGLDKFTDSIESFRENFLTEAERIAPVAKAVTDEMNRLGFGFVDTREEFKLLVQSLNLNIPAQREVYLSLMLVADSFAKVYESTSESLDANEYKNRLLEQEIAILDLLGKRTESITLSRQQEIEELEKLGVAQSTQLIYNQKVIWALEDALEVRSAEADLLGTLGRTYEQVIMQREDELRGLSDNLKVLKKAQYAAEDYNNSQGLMVELLRLEGKEKQATAILRQNELKGLSQVDKAIKQTIFAMEDEAALREELKTSREEETNTLQDVISKTKDYIKSLKDYRASLLVGNLSILTPAQKYEEAKARALELAAKAGGPATTKEEIEARDAARGGLQSATSAWLEASRTLFASSEGYVTDFNKVLELLDQSTIGATEQLTEAEKQLKAINDSIAVQNSIETNTKDTAELLRQLVASQQAAESFKASIPANLETYYGLDKLDISITSLASVLDRAVASIERPIVTPPPPDIGQPGQSNQAIADGIKNIPSFNTNNDTEALRRQIASLQEEIKGLREDNVENTSALIEAGYRSNVDNADAVTTGISDIFNEFQWRDSNKVQLR